MVFPNRGLLIVFMVVSMCATQVNAQPGAALVPEASVALPGVSGRIDHLAFDRGRQRLFVAALGNNTLEVIDLHAGRRIDAIRGLASPQGVAYAEQSDTIFVANADDGSVRLFRGADLAPVGRIELQDDADNIRIDPRNGTVIVGYGAGGLAVIDPMNHGVLGKIKLPGHPEGFQIDPGTGRAFVNIPDASQISVVDLDARRVIATWKNPGASSNFPMALDPTTATVAVVYRNPARLVVFNAATGAVVAQNPVCGDADDVFFDTKRQRIYVTCGAGEISILQRDGSAYRALPSVKTSSGARTSLFVPDIDRLFVAVRAALLGSNASIGVYRPGP